MSSKLCLSPEFLLPEPITLRLYVEGEIVFFSEKHWLHPLFDLETFFLRGCDPGSAVLVDRITGRAAAFLIARLGIRQLCTRVLSRPALSILNDWGIKFTCTEVIESLPCATEAMLREVHDPELAYSLIRERWERTKSTAGES